VPTSPLTEASESGGIHVGDVGGNVTFNALGDIVARDKITTFTTIIQVAKERERERTQFQQRALEASRKATERGLQILKESAKGSKPSDAARLLAVGDAIGRAALGLNGGTSLGGGHFPHPVAAPVITVIHQEGDALRAARADTRRFIAEHPDHSVVRRYLEARARGLPPQFGETE
jgi:hypothetical protein